MKREEDHQGDSSSSTLSTALSLPELEIPSTETESTQSSHEKEKDGERKRETTSGTPTRKAASRPVAKPASSVTIKRGAKRSKWDAENIVSDPKSPLAKADLRRLLANPMAWEILDASDRAEILALLPDKEHILDPGSDNARPNLMSLMNDDTFRHDCATYTENISLGRFDPEWLACAWSAHERRKLGDFDEHLVDKFETEWHVNLPQDFKPKRHMCRNSPNEAANSDDKSGETTTQDVKDEGDSGPGDSENKDPEPEPIPKEAKIDEVDSDAMSIDELQADDPQPKAPSTPSVWKQRRNSTIIVAGFTDEDELA